MKDWDAIQMAIKGMKIPLKKGMKKVKREIGRERERDKLYFSLSASVPRLARREN